MKNNPEQTMNLKKQFEVQPYLKNDLIKKIYSESSFWSYEKPHLLSPEHLEAMRELPY